MSELKVTTVYDAYWKATSVGEGTGILVYLKSEVDAVLAEMEKKLDLYKRGFKEDDRINAYLYAELRHQKYRRCLAMAEMCKARYDEEGVKVNWCGLSWEYVSKEMKYWERWYKRWLELAEKFKEVVHA